MITRAQILPLIEEKLIDNNCFLVELLVGEGNAILLEIDSYDGVSVNDCVKLSKAIDNHLDREEEDFELKVSSAGLDKPLRVVEQYKKNKGRTVKVVPINGTVIKGELTEVNDDEIIVVHSYKEKIEGKKKKQTILKEEQIKFNNIKETTVVVSFK